jgi:TPR repeat protein
MKRTILPISLAFCSPVFAVGSTTEYLFHSSTNDLFKNIQEPEPNHNATLDPQESKPTVNEELSPKEKFELAMTTLNQNGNFNQDKVKILNLLTESASGGYGDAQLVLGKNYLHGALSDKDEKSAFAWLSLAAEKNSDAQVYFKEKVLDNHWTEYEWLWDAKQFTKNLCKKLSLPIPKFILDEEARFNEASSKSVNGDPEATFDLADFYETGKGVRPNSEKGVELIRTAAIKGSTRAHYRVACSFYLIGNPYKFLNP